MAGDVFYENSFGKIQADALIHGQEGIIMISLFCYMNLAFDTTYERMI